MALTSALKRWEIKLRRAPFHPQCFLNSARSSRDLLLHASGRTVDIGSAQRWPQQLLPGDCQHISLDCPAKGVKLYG